MIILIIILFILNIEIGFLLGLNLARKSTPVANIQNQRCSLSDIKQKIQQTLKPGETFECFKYPFNFDPSMGFDEKKFFAAKFFSGIIQESRSEATYKGILARISKDKDRLSFVIKNSKDDHEFLFGPDNIQKIEVFEQTPSGELKQISLDDLNVGDPLIIKSTFRYFKNQNEIANETIKFQIIKQ